MTTPLTRPARLFYSYSSVDERMRAALDRHLQVLVRAGLIETWSFRRVVAGQHWEDEIDAALERADVVLFLVSSDFMASEYCWNVEVRKALERERRGEAVVVPVILRSCDWKVANFAHLQALPRDAKPIASWKPRDQGWTSVVEGVRDRIQRISWLQEPARPELAINTIGFREWLHATAQAMKTPYISKDLPLRVGSCTLFDAANEANGYRSVVLEKLARQDPIEIVDARDRDSWQKVRETLVGRQVRGVSAQVVKFVGQLTDDRVARLQYRVIDYVDGRAFHEILADQREALARYRDRVLRIGSVGGDVLNILSTGVVVIISDADGNPLLLLANRMARHGGYDPESWAVTIGEQFMPEDGHRGPRFLAADPSIESSAARGVREELLGPPFVGDLHPQVIAFALEDYLDNPFLIAVLDLRHLTFSDVRGFWQTAEDQREHHTIAAIPLQRDVLWKALNSDALPEDLWNEAVRSGLTASITGTFELAREHQVWQPNSHIRIAAALWFADTRLRSP
jgi:hypothetical protein